MLILKQWRLWISLLLLIGSYLSIKPNFESQTSDNKINFGLDIQGGYSYLLELNEEEYLNNLLVKTSQYIENTYSISSSINNGQIVISKNQNLEALSNIVIQKQLETFPRAKVIGNTHRLGPNKNTRKLQID